MLVWILDERVMRGKGMGGGGRQWISLKNGRKISMFKVRGWEGGGSELV